jgi:hypothetical protein
MVAEYEGGLSVAISCSLMAAWLTLPSVSYACSFEGKPSPVIEVSPDVYKTQCDTDLFLVMERIDRRSGHHFWTKFVDNEFRLASVYQQRIKSGENVPVKFRPEAVGGDRGLEPFRISVEDFGFNIEDEPGHGGEEIWVVYASSSDVNGPASSPDDIEMFMSVLTTEGAPIVVDVGIQRSFGYLLQLLVANPSGDGGIKPKRKHDRLAVELHSMAAKVMLLREPKKLYMITKPVPKMREILAQALPHDVFVGDSRDRAAQLYKQSFGKDPHEDTNKETYNWMKKINAGIDMPKNASPIHADIGEHKIKIFDKERKHVVFAASGVGNRHAGDVFVYGQKVPNANAYEWFVHKYIHLYIAQGPYVTVNLDAPANLDAIH